MFFSQTQAESLTIKLTAELAPICDADPSVLAEYILALLRHDKPRDELKSVCLQQLADFLGQGETAPFVDRLFLLIAELNPPDNIPPRESGLSSASRRDTNDNYNTRDRERNVGRERDTRDNRDRSMRDSSYNRGQRDERRPREYRSSERDSRDNHDVDYRGEDRERDRRDRRDLRETISSRSAGIQRQAEPRLSYVTRPPTDSADTLIVLNIPPAYYAIDKITQFFAAYGDLTNVQLISNYRAVIKYSTHQEAYECCTSHATIFDSRFVRVVWLGEAQRNEIDGELESISAASQIKKKELQDTVAKHRAILVAQQAGKRDTARVARAALIERQISEQKRVFALIEDPNCTAAEKERLLENLKVLGESFQNIMSTTPKPVDIGTVYVQQAESDQVADAVKAEYMRLKGEAAELGVTLPSRGRGGFRGRGRGGVLRGGSGAGPRYKLDNRPTKFILQHLPQHFQECKTHYERMPGFISILPTESGTIVQFDNRAEAEWAIIRPLKCVSAAINWAVTQVASSGAGDMNVDDQSGDMDL